MLQEEINSIADRALKYNALQIKEELVWLLQMADSLPHKNIAVELGTCGGGTFYALTKFFKKVFSIDGGKVELPFNVRKQDQYLIGNTKNKDIISIVGDNVDFLLIDADHSYEGVKKDFALWGPKVLKGGLIFFHDINGAVETDGVKEFWLELKQTHKYNTDEIISSNKYFGIGVIHV